MHAIFKRKYRTLALLAVVAVLFYLLQCLTVSKLGQLTSSKRDRKWSDTDLLKDFVGLDADDGEPLMKQRNRIVDADSKFDIDIKQGEHFDRDHNAALKPQMKNVNIQQQKDDSVKRNGPVHMSINEIEIKVGAKKSYHKPVEETTVCRNKVDGMNAREDEAAKDSALKQTHSSLLGVHPSQRHLYKADGNNMFVCLTAPQIHIPYERVNDDYCDCPDSSDEPGTSACPDSKFYCTRQLAGSPPQYVMSSKVNDGICDCCDGSDEWFGALMPNHMRIKDGEPQGAVFHSPCMDKCGAIIAVHQQEEKIRAKGKELQKEYLKQATSELTESEKKNYGPNGVFYPLSKQCFKIHVKQYEYEVCPFSKVTQEAFPHSPVTLGRTATVTLEKGQHVVVMDGGDNQLCPFGRARKAKIYLLCGLENKLMRVAESELCEYSFTMSSPAAC